MLLCLSQGLSTNDEVVQKWPNKSLRTIDRHLSALFLTLKLEGEDKKNFAGWKLAYNNIGIIIYIYVCVCVCVCVYGLPSGYTDKESCQCRRHRRLRFDPWVRKIWKREWPTHSSILSWRIPWTEEPSGLQSRESQRVRHS